VGPKNNNNNKSSQKISQAVLYVSCWHCRPSL